MVEEPHNNTDAATKSNTDTKANTKTTTQTNFYTKDNVIIFCKDRTDLVGYNIGAINDLIIIDISAFKDNILVLCDMGDKLNKILHLSSQQVDMKL